jgi:hypothetical protein
MIFLALLILFIFSYSFKFLIEEGTKSREAMNLIETITLVFIVITIIVCLLNNF